MKKKGIVCFIIIVFIIVAFSVVNYAADGIDTDSFKDIYNNDGQTAVFKMGGAVIAITQVISLVVAIVMLLVLGIRYMYASPSDKASIKDRMIPFVIGAFLVFGASSLLDILAKFASSALN